MDTKDMARINEERKILRTFFERIIAIPECDRTIDSKKCINDTKKQLRVALRGSKNRCTCNRCKYTICEVCQGSDRDLVDLRHFFITISNIEKSTLTAVEIQKFIENARKRLDNF